MKTTTLQTATLALGILAAASAAVLAASTVQVGQRNRLFEKTTVSIAAGDSVEFLNNDTVAHNVMESGADAFNLGVMKPGEKKSRKFDRAGKHEVKCALHPRMKMTVEVK
jgi:plastocyanin